MSAGKKTEKVGRREFLKLAGVSAASGGAALAAPGVTSQAKASEADRKTGYRETEHVKTYYKLARF